MKKLTATLLAAVATAVSANAALGLDLTCVVPPPDTDPHAVVALRITGEEYGNTIRNLQPVFTLQNGETRDRSVQYRKGWRVEPVNSSSGPAVMWQGYYGPGNHHTVAFVKPNDPNETYREDHYTDKGVLDHKDSFSCSPTGTQPTVAYNAAPPPTQKVNNITGTGFVISDAGHVVTNNHVVKDCVGEIRGNFVGESAAALRLVSADEPNDLALLQTHEKPAEVASIGGTRVHSGDSVIAIGFPFRGLLTSDLTVTTGIISSLSGILNDSRFMQISAPVQPGNSGGPLLDTSGHVVGVVTEKLNALQVAKATGSIPENVNFAIKTGMLRDFLDNNVVSYRTADSTSELKTSEIASAARAYTILISCSGGR